MTLGAGAGSPLVSFEELLREPLRNGIYKAKEFHGRGVRIINMGDLFAHEFVGSQEMRRVELTDREREKYLVEDGDLLFARRSYVLEGSGKCSLVESLDEDCTFESSLIRARLDRAQAEPRFYYYLFRSPLGRELMATIATRTAVSGIKGSDLARLVLPCPPRPVQGRVASLLSAYDDLIENNRRRIALLEQMAQAIHREWFVHFRYPGHEDEFVNSPIGPIPVGWEVSSVSDAVEINPLIRAPRGLEVPFVTMGDLTAGLMNVAPSTTRAFGAGGSRFQRDDTLFARITPSVEHGKTGFVQFLQSGEVGMGSTEFLVFRGRRVSAYSTYLLARREDLRLHAIGSMSGASGRQRVNNECFDAFEIAIPPASLEQQFASSVRPAFAAVEVLSQLTRRLEQIRDLLLPKLVTGAIDVSKLDLDSLLDETAA